MTHRINNKLYLFRNLDGRVDLAVHKNKKQRCVSRCFLFPAKYAGSTPGCFLSPAAGNLIAPMQVRRLPDSKSGTVRFLMAIVLDLRLESCDGSHCPIDLRRHFGV